jgi:hypothetical protein
MAPLDLEIKFEFIINSVDVLVVLCRRFQVAHVQEAQAETPVALVVRQNYQSVGNEAVFCVHLSCISAAGLADVKCLAREPDGG